MTLARDARQQPRQRKRQHHERARHDGQHQRRPELERRGARQAFGPREPLRRGLTRPFAEHLRQQGCRTCSAERSAVRAAASGLSPTRCSSARNASRGSAPACDLEDHARPGAAQRAVRRALAHRWPAPPETTARLHRERDEVEMHAAGRRAASCSTRRRAARGTAARPRSRARRLPRAASQRRRRARDAAINTGTPPR